MNDKNLNIVNISGVGGRIPLYGPILINVIKHMRLNTGSDLNCISGASSGSLLSAWCANYSDFNNIENVNWDDWRDEMKQKVIKPWIDIEIKNFLKKTFLKNEAQILFDFINRIIRLISYIYGIIVKGSLNSNKNLFKSVSKFINWDNLKKNNIILSTGIIDINTSENVCFSLDNETLYIDKDDIQYYTDLYIHFCQWF